MAFDLARAETVMQLIIDRDEAAIPTFRGLLQDIATSGLPKTGQSRCHGPSSTQYLQELGNQADNKHKQNERPRRQCLKPCRSILQHLDVSHVSRSNARGARRVRYSTKRRFRALIALVLRVIRSSAGTVEIPSPVS